MLELIDSARTDFWNRDEKYNSTENTSNNAGHGQSLKTEAESGHPRYLRGRSLAQPH